MESGHIQESLITKKVLLKPQCSATESGCSYNTTSPLFHFAMIN